MTRRLLLLILPLLLAVGGCTHLTLSDEELLSRIDRDIAQHNFRRADTTLQQLSVASRNKGAWRKRYKRLQQKQQHYEHTQLSRAQHLEQQGNFVAADKLYREALSRLPDSSPLTDAYQTFQQQQQQQLDRILLQSQIIRARYLIDTIHLYQGKHLTLTNVSLAESTLNTYRAEATRLAATLQQAGGKAIEQDDYALATTTITLAWRLAPNNPQVAKSRAVLKQRAAAIAKHVTKLKREAAGHYGSENYNRALQLWEEALILTPHDHEITTRIARVRRVLDSLQQIQQAQQ